MYPNQHSSQAGTAEPKRWRVELLTEIVEEQARQVEDDYRRAFDTQQLDAAVQTARRPRLALALAVLVLALGAANVLIPHFMSGGGGVASASPERKAP